MRTLSAVVLAALLALVLTGCGADPKPAGNEGRADSAGAVPAPVVDQTAPVEGTEQIVLAGGCFWGVQAVFQHVDGVLSAVSGYAGGDKATADYEDVSSGRTEHAEAVAITFDPKVVSLGTILHIFFSVVHDPTQLNKQGPDHGTQYRSAIFPANAEQERVAAAYIKQLTDEGGYADPVVTTIEKGQEFFAAEDYHQDFLVLNPDNNYIVVNDQPKVEALEKMFPKEYRPEPVLVNAG